MRSSLRWTSAAADYPWLPLPPPPTPTPPACPGDCRRKKDHGRAEALLLAAWGLGVRMEPLAAGDDDDDDGAEGVAGGSEEDEDEDDPLTQLLAEEEALS